MEHIHNHSTLKTNQHPLLRKLYYGFNHLEELVGGTGFLVIFVVVIWEIFARKVLNAPLTWSEQLAELLFVYVGMLGVSMAIRKQQHVFLDFLTNFMHNRVKKFFFSFVQLLTFFCLILFIYFGFVLYKNAFFPIITLGITQKWLYASLPIISIIMLIRFIQAEYENYYVKQSQLIHPLIFVALAVIIGLVLYFDPSFFRSFRIYNYIHLTHSVNAAFISLLIWLVIMFVGTPVGWSLFLSGIIYFDMTRWPTVNFAAQKLVDSLNSFTLLAVPFFILTGILMNNGGITTKIFNFARSFLGHYRGGLGHVNVGASLIFSGMSGSALADAGGLGQLEIKAMRDAGYDDDICGGLTAASCIIGPLVPPSIAMIIYGVIANQSIAKLFLAGFVPGVLVTIALMVMNWYIAKRRGYPISPKANFSQRWVSFKEAIWAILTPLIIIGGIFSGIFTPTEAAAIAALYSIIVGFFVYKELTFAKLWKAIVEALAITGVTMLMVMTVTFFGDMIAREQIAIHVSNLFIEIANSKLLVLVMINMLLLFLGMFIDALALQFLVLPVLIPIATHFGVDLIFFGVMTTLNMMIGILTPPMGMALFVVARVGNMSVSTVTKGVLPFLIPIFITLVMITIFPEIVTFIPNLLLGG